MSNNKVTDNTLLAAILIPLSRFFCDAGAVGVHATPGGGGGAGVWGELRNSALAVAESGEVSKAKGNRGGSDCV